MKKIILISAVLIYSTAGFSTTWTITNSSFTFSPATLTILQGDDVNFVVASIHSIVEVSKATWDVGGTTPLPGGFSTPLGGGNVTPSQLTLGTHWYVCAIHGSIGMKGIITVDAITGTKDIQSPINISLFPNPVKNIITITTNNFSLNMHYFITNLGGRQILAGEINNESLSIDISEFDKGVYLFQIAGQRIKTIKIIKN